MSVVAETVVEAQLVEHRRGFAGRWYRTPSFVAGATILGLIVLAAIAAPLITNHGPTSQDLLNTLQGPSSKHWLGTDDLGRDVWSRLVYGARTDLKVAFLAVLFPFAIGTLIIALVFALGSGTRNIYIAITIVGWVSYTRIIRGEVLVAKRRDYVLAAKSGGLSDARILFRHLLPNVVTQAIVFACSDIVLDILAIVTLGYLGLGVQPPTADWGRMIADGQTFLTTHWELSTFPGIAVVITALGLSLLADGLADLLRPE